MHVNNGQRMTIPKAQVVNAVSIYHNICHRSYTAVIELIDNITILYCLGLRDHE